MKLIAELKIQHYLDRQNIVSALASAGYAVKVVERNNKPYRLSGGEFYVLIYEDEQEVANEAP